MVLAGAPRVRYACLSASLSLSSVSHIHSPTHSRERLVCRRTWFLYRLRHGKRVGRESFAYNSSASTNLPFVWFISFGSLTGVAACTYLHILLHLAAARAVSIYAAHLPLHYHHYFNYRDLQPTSYLRA